MKATSDLVTLDSGHRAVQVTEWIDPDHVYVPQEVLDNHGLTAAAFLSTAPRDGLMRFAREYKTAQGVRARQVSERGEAS